MKKLLLLLLLTVPVQAQDTVRVKHGNYESVFSVRYRYPILVEWWVTKAKLECVNPVKRQDRFLPDPLLRRESNLDNDYRGSGFDRGHLSPAADARCNANHMKESFYFTNMAPQTAGLNRGQWKNLEEWTRYLAIQNDSVFVRAGCIGESRRIYRVAVPTHCWKIIVVKRTNETIAYVFPNTREVTNKSFEVHRVSLDSINKLTGFRFSR